jgi:hypothetical protein
VEVFARDFTNRITEGFKMAALYGDVTDSPFEMPMEYRGIQTEISI